MIFGNSVEVFKMNDEGGKIILERTKTKVLMTNKEELIDGIMPLKFMQGVVGCCISTSLSMISFLSFLSICSSFVLNSFSCLTLSFSSNSRENNGKDFKRYSQEREVSHMHKLRNQAFPSQRSLECFHKNSQ